MKFSIIIPVYNKANTIVQALDSVFSQTFKDFEVIVVNDGSTDNVLEVLKSYNNPVKVITQRNGGVSVARNKGIENANGDYLCFLDADDLWYPNHLETICDMMLAYPDEKFFGTCHSCSFPDGKVVDCNRRISSLDDVLLVKDLIAFINQYGGVVNTNGICVSRDILIIEDIKFEPGEKLGEDVDVWYRVALKHSIVISKNVTNLYRREYSTATVVTSNPPDWCFAKRAESILKDPDIPQDVKSSYLNMCDRYFMAISRELSYRHARLDAKRKLNNVNNKRSFRYLFSLLLTILPYQVLDAFPARMKI